MQWKLAGLLFAFTVSTVAVATPGSQPAGQMIGQIGGPTQAVAVQGKYAYVGVGLRLIVLDVSDPTSPREVGSSPPFSDFVRDIAVSGTVAYVAAGGAGLRVVDVADPAHPAEIGSLQSRGYAEGVAVSGTTVCVAHGPYGLRVIDVSNPKTPTEIGAAFTRNYAFKVAMAGRYAYVAAAGAGLLVADLTNPAQPSEVATLATPGYAYGLAVSGNTAYVAGGWEGLLSVDVTSKGPPRLLGHLQTAGWAFGVTVSGTRAYVAAGQGGLRVIDVSNPAGLTEVGGLAVAGGDAAGVAVSGTIAYLADRNWGLEAVNLSAPASPVQVGFYGPLGYADEIAVTGNYAYVAAGSYGLRIVDISDPARPRQVGAYDTQSYAKSVVVEGDYAYVAANSFGPGEGLHVVDIRNPAHPIRAGFTLEGGTPYRAMTLAGGIVYIPNEVGLVLFDVSNPAKPKMLSFLRTLTSNDQNIAVGVAVSGNVAYVALEQQGLLAVDVSNPSAPAAIGQFQWPNAYARDLVVSEGKAYVADSGALTVLDVSDPRAPVWLASYPTSGSVWSLVIAGDQVLAACGGAGLSVIDVSKPASPVLAWTYNTPGYAQSVFARDDLIFVADSSGGLVILGKPGGGTALLDGTATPPHVVVSRAMAPRVAPPPVRAGAAPLPAARSAGAQAASSCVVTSSADSGAGTLRDCLERATSGTTITFDPAVFPPSRPRTIAPLSALPHILNGHVTLDASNAGVILDGSGTPPSTRGLGIGSSGNIIMGLQIVRFPSDGIVLFGPGIKEGNLIGGSRNRGNSPLGEGNLISGNGGNGISIGDARVTNTTIAGNFIGTDITGTAAMGNRFFGIFVVDSPNNRIGGSRPEERNVISGNSSYGIELIGGGSAGNSISGNYIGVDASGSKELSNGGNGGSAVGLERGANANLVQGNVIVATSRQCIVIYDPGSSYNTIVGNLLGTDASGKVALGSVNLAVAVGGGASFNRIGGTTPADRNVIAQGGIGFGLGAGNLLIGNFIGTDISGSIILAKRGSGVSLGDSSNRPFIGGTTAGERNVISGNPYGGIQVGPAGDYTFIGGNYIGTDASGHVALGNGGAGGILISQGTHNIVQGNLIAHHNPGAGITVSGYAGNTLRQNLIHDNKGGGIVLKDGGNNGVSPPVITSVSATGVSGTACAGCEVEIFSDSVGEGRMFEGATVSDPSGAFTFTKASGYLVGPNVTATATDGDGSTSGFSAPVRVLLAITTFSPLPAGTIGLPYSLQLATTGGTGSLTWSVVSGSLPGGLALSAGGLLSGTPAAAGSYTFTVQVSDSAGKSTQGAFTLIISACTAPGITTQPQAASVQSGQAATLSVTASGASPLVYLWYQGVKGDTSNAVGSNAAAFTTPSLNVTTSYWVRVSNGCGHADSVTATVTVGPAYAFAIWVPSSARATGLGGAFYTTDLTVANTGITSTTFVVKFLGNNADGRGGPEKSFPIGAGASTTFSDVLGSVFGLTSDYGAIRITSPSDSVRVLAQTSTPGFGGTFGQSVPAARPADLITGGTPRSILAVREDDSFRTNLILANATEDPLDVDVTLVADSGTVLKTAAKRFTLPPLGMTQVTRVVRVLGVTTDVSGVRLVVSTPSIGKSFAAYASAIDNVTNDPRALLPVGPTVGARPSPDYWILPSSARANGAGGAFYTTDVTVAYTNAVSARYTLKFLGHDVDGRSGPETTFDLGPQKSVTYTDVLGSVFQRTSDYGAIRVASQYPSSDSNFIGVLAQTSTPGFGGTFGQSVPAATAADLIRTGTARSILAVREDGSFRTNLILANATEATLDVDAQLISAEGPVLATKRYSLAPLGMTQVTRVVRDMGINASVNGARLVISTPTTSGAFAAYASAIDNVTNDPRTLLPR